MDAGRPPPGRSASWEQAAVTPLENKQASTRDTGGGESGSLTDANMKALQTANNITPRSPTSATTGENGR
ncbi:hypothetical protein NHX12_019183, partial [Muraenolepis orangiensis]